MLQFHLVDHCYQPEPIIQTMDAKYIYPVPRLVVVATVFPRLLMYQLERDQASVATSLDFAVILDIRSVSLLLLPLLVMLGVASAMVE